MNKNRYRIIFNKARGMFMAVAENAKSQSKNSGQSVGVQDSSVKTEVSFNQLWQVKALVLSLSILTPFAPLYAQVQADQSAGINQRAVIAAGKTPSGQVVPVVNIQTPKNGVSHNVYQSFDVLNEGLVLNNSRTGARSQLVQSVAANPLLQKGEARVILNEVKGGASRFEGNLEVAGQMADVIIANPAGINIKGGGFINTNRATLTTGTPVLNTDGSIQKYNIQQGKISINAQPGSSLGLGGKQNNANYVDIYTRALDLNAQMHVNADALVVTGANEIDEKTQRPVVQEAKNKASNFAVDVKKLGGMYADNIYLIATEQGLGVQNHGTLQAKKNLVITSAGKIENRWGTIETTDQKEGILSLQTTSSGVTGDINSDGLIQSPNLVSLNASNDINIYHNQIKTTQDGSRIQLIAEKNINLKPDGKITKDGVLGAVELYGQGINVNAGASIQSQGKIILSAKDRIQLDKASKLNAVDNITALTNGEFKATSANIETVAGDVVLQSTNENKALSKLNLQDTTINAGGDTTFYSNGRIELKDFTFTPVAQDNLVILKDINIYTGENLVWSNPLKRLPIIAGNLNVQAQGEANLEQTNLETVGNLTVNATAIKLPQSLKSQSDLAITTQNSDLNIAGKTLEAQDQLELTASKGHVQAQGTHLTSKDAGIHIYAQKDINLTPQQANTAQLNAQSDIKVVNLEQGNIRLTGAQIKSVVGNVLFDAKRDIQAFDQKDQLVSLQGQDVTFKATRNIDFNNVDVNAQKNINISANQDLYLKGMTSRSGQNTLISAGDQLYLNTQSNRNGWVSWEAPVTSRKSNLNSQGLLSVKSGKHQFIRNTELKGGAVITNAGWSLQTQGSISFTAQKTETLAKDVIYKPYNGLLQIQSSDHLTINPHTHLLSSNGDIALISKAGKLTLQHTDTKDVNLQTAGSIRLQGADLDLQQANLQANQNITIATQKDTPQKADEGQLDIKGSRIEAKQGNVSISANGRLNTSDENNKRTVLTGQDISLNSLKNMVDIKNTDINSKRTAEIKSADFMMLHNSNINSGQHLILNSKKRLYINGQKANDSWATVWDADTNQVNLNAQGILSLKSGHYQQLKNVEMKGGSIHLNADILVSKGQVGFTTVETNFLQQNAKPDEKALNGSLTINTKRELLFDPRIHKFNVVQDLNLISSDNKLVLVGHAGKAGNGSEEILNLASKKGSVLLKGTSVDIQGSKINAEKDIKLTSTQGDLSIDGVKNTFTNKSSEDLVKLNQAQYDSLDIHFSKFKETERFKKYREKMDHVQRKFIDTNHKNRQHHLDYATNLHAKTIKEEKGYLDNLNEFKAKTQFFSQALNGYEHAEANLTSRTGNIGLLSAKGVSISGADLNAQNGIIDIEARESLDDRYTLQTKKNDNQDNIGASIIIDGHTDFYEKGKETNKNYQMRTQISPTTLNGAKGVNIRAVGKSENDNLVLQATEITSPQGNVNIEANRSIILDAGLEQSYDHSVKNEKRRSWWGKTKTTKTTAENNKVDAIGVDINAKNILIESKEQNPNVNVDIYSANLKANGGRLTVKSGGNINFYSVEEQENSNVEVTKRSSFLKIKYNKSKTNSTRSQVDALPAKLTADYIGTKSGFDTRLEGTEFNYLKGATIEAGGKLILLGAKSSLTETTKTEKESIVWQSTQDKGFVQETAKLPTFNGGGIAPVFKAAGGLEVQIPIGEKDAGKKQIRDEILKLAKQPGNEYLNDLVKRNDVNWQEIILAQKDWDYKSQGLTAAGAAILAIAIACVTAGAGAALVGTTAAVGTTGATVTTAAGFTLATTTAAGATTFTTAGLMVNAAVTSLATQASIGLVNNGGDLKQTFKDLGKKESVQRLVTAVVTAGVSSQLNSVLPPTIGGSELAGNFVNSFATETVNGLVTAGITGQKVNFEGLLKQALLNSVADTAQAGMSGQIKNLQSDSFDTSYILHKVAHAAAGCVAAGIAQQDCASGAIGAAVGEAVAEKLLAGRNPTFLTAQEKSLIDYQAQLVAGSVAALTGYDVNTATHRSTIAVHNNGFKDKFLEKAKETRRYLDQKSQKALDDLEAAYKRMDIPAAKAAKERLDNHLEAWVLAGGTDNKTRAAIGALAYAVGEIAIPTNATDLVPVGKLKKFGAVKDIVEDSIAARKGTTALVENVKTEADALKNQTAIIEKKQACFTAGTLIETNEGLKPIETFVGGELVWSRHQHTLEYGYRPVISTKRTEDQQIYSVEISNADGKKEVLETTEEHPFWVKGHGWLKASLLESGMTLFDHHNRELTVVNQSLVSDYTTTVYNIEIKDYHTYHVGELCTWVHNASCNEIKKSIQKIEKEYGYAGVHSLSRHGAGTTLEQQKYRARTGIPPDEPNRVTNITNPVKHLPDATRFINNSDLEYALQYALKSPQKVRGKVEVDFGKRVVGEGYYAGGKVYGKATKVQVTFDKQTGELVSAFPVLPKLK